MTRAGGTRTAAVNAMNIPGVMPYGIPVDILRDVLGLYSVDTDKDSSDRVPESDGSDGLGDNFDTCEAPVSFDGCDVSCRLSSVGGF